MPQVLSAAGAPKAFGDVGRNGNRGAAELSGKSIPFYLGKLTRDPVRLDKQHHTGLPRDEIAMRSRGLSRCVTLLTVSHEGE